MQAFSSGEALYGLWLKPEWPSPNSSKESKKTANEVAKDVAVASSKTEFNNIFTVQYKNEVFEQATAATNKLINEEIENLKKDIITINKKIEELELKQIGVQKSDTQISQEEVEELVEIVEPENPFDKNDE